MTARAAGWWAAALALAALLVGYLAREGALRPEGEPRPEGSAPGSEAPPQAVESGRGSADSAGSAVRPFADTRRRDKVGRKTGKPAAASAEARGTRLVLELLDAETSEPLGGGVCLVRLLGFRRERTEECRVTGEGRVTLTAIEQGPHAVEVRREGYLSAQALVEVAGEEVTATLLLARGVSLLGVVYGEAGRPVPGASVLAYRRESGPGSARALSDAEGRFRIDGLEPGTWTLFAGARGYAPAGPVELELPREQVIEIRLERGVEIGMRALGPQGGPLAGVHIRARLDGAPPRGPGTYEVVSDASGRARIAGLPPGRSLLIEARYRGYPPVRLVREVADLAAQEVELRFEAPAAVEGVVLGEDGKPVAGAKVTLLGPRAEVSASQASSRADFRFEGLEPGTYRLRATSPAAGFAVVSPLTIEPGEVRHVELRLARGPGRVRGRVVWPGAQGRETRALVRLQAGPFLFQTTAAGAGGRFEFAGLPEPPYAIEARLAGLGLRARAYLPALQEEEVLLRLEVPGGIAGFLAPELAGASIAVAPLDAPGARPRTVAASGGSLRFRVRDLVPGAYEIRALLDGKPAGRSGRIKVEPGRTAGPVILVPDPGRP